MQYCVKANSILTSVPEWFFLRARPQAQMLSRVLKFRMGHFGTSGHVCVTVSIISKYA